ncbi:MAG: hypothetical protein JRD68_02475 [Deltaproteobacteria bacterium]|nr:hypothetical protein [Deltaproteobacteria bacterium]
MRKGRKLIGVIWVAALIGVLASSSALAADFAVTAKFGTPGLGGDLTKGIVPNINGRLNINWLNYDYSSTASDVAYSFNLKLLTIGALADWYPGEGGFRVTGGIYFNNNQISGTGRLTSGGPFEIGPNTYTAAQLGALTAGIDFNTLAPYIGIGWGNPLRQESRWTFAFDLGVLYQGSPKVTLTATNPTAIAALNTDLATEQDSVAQALRSFKFYPVLTLGISYNF